MTSSSNTSLEEQGHTVDGVAAGSMFGSRRHPGSVSKTFPSFAAGQGTRPRVTDGARAKGGSSRRSPARNRARRRRPCEDCRQSSRGRQGPFRRLTSAQPSAALLVPSAARRIRRQGWRTRSAIRPSGLRRDRPAHRSADRAVSHRPEGESDRAGLGCDACRAWYWRRIQCPAGGSKRQQGVRPPRLGARSGRRPYTRPSSTGSPIFGPTWGNPVEDHSSSVPVKKQTGWFTFPQLASGV